MQYEPLMKVYYKYPNDYEDVYSSRFNSEFTYHYDLSIGKFNAFVVVNLDILNVVAKIYQIDKALSKIMTSLPVRAQNYFCQTCLIDEVKLSNEIESVYSTKKELRAVINPKNKKKRFFGIVKKYMMLLQGEKLNLRTCQDIRTLYDEFILDEVKENDPENFPDGDIFRKGPVEVVSSTQKTIHKGVYPEKKIINLMSLALDELNSEERNMEYLIKVAVFHYLFGYIHPFYDGNGRMARFISSYLIIQKLERVVGFGLSYTIKNKINKYYDMFKDSNDVKNRGDLTPFVIGFLYFIKEAVENLHEIIDEKSEKFQFYNSKLNNCAVNDGQREILKLLVQSTIFNEEELKVNDIVQMSGMGLSKVRAILGSINKEILQTRREGKFIIYNINLDALAELE